MKQIITTLALAFGMIAVPLHGKAECNINLSVARAYQTENIPARTETYLESRLQQALTADGVSVGEGVSQFFVAGKFTHVMEDVVVGPPMQKALHTTLTLYIGDLQSETVYATTTLDLRGVGTSSERAFINAMRTLNGANPKIEAFIAGVRKKIVSYFDANYQQIFAQADRAASQHKYEEALWRLNMIPECCIAYDQALAKSKKVYQHYIDQQGTALLSKAFAVWGASHDASAAEDAFGYLLQIDPESSAYAGAQKLAKEISASVKSDRDFELREKYHDSIDLEKNRIDAAREVGVAYGKGQQPQTTNIMWLR